MDEHAAAAAGRVQKHAALGFQHVDDHLDQGFGREEHAVVLGDVLGELVEEVLIDAADHVAAHLVDGAVVEDAQQLGKELVGKIGVALGQDALELLALGFDEGHGVVDHLAQAVHGMALRVPKARRGNVCRKGQQVGILGLTGEEQGVLRHKVAGLHRQHPAAPGGSILQDGFLHLFEAAVCVAQEYEPQHGHAILIGRQLGTLSKQIGGFPQFSFQLANVDHERYR